MLLSCLIVVSLSLVGCKNSENSTTPSNSVAVNADSPAPSEPVLEATTVKITVDGESVVRLTSFLDDFEITLPLDFRGTILTEREIAAFSGRIKTEVATLADQIKYQCNTLRSSGGVLFAMNMRPTSVVDGFADNMNVSIRGVKEQLDIGTLKNLMLKELSGQKPDIKIATSEIKSEEGPMLEFQFSAEEGPTKIKVTRQVFSMIRKNQVFMIAFACAKSKATKVAPAFRKSAQSLSFL